MQITCDLQSKEFFNMTTLWFDKFFENWKKNLACHMWSGNGFFSMTTLSFDEIFRILWFWFFKRKILYIIEVGNFKLYNLWICYIKGNAFSEWGQFLLNFMHLCLCENFAKIVPILYSDDTMWSRYSTCLHSISQLRLHINKRFD